MWPFKNKKQHAVESESRRVDLSLLSDEAGINFIADTLKDWGPPGCAQFIVALFLADIYLDTFKKAVVGDGLRDRYSLDWAGYANFCLDSYKEIIDSCEGIEYEVGKHRTIYLFTAAHLERLQLRAHSHAELWDKIAPLWIPILEGSLLLHNVIKNTQLWRNEDMELFRNISTPKEGQEHVEACYLPKEIRYHKILEDWRDRDLTSDQKTAIDRDIEELMKMMNG